VYSVNAVRRLKAETLTKNVPGLVCLLPELAEIQLLFEKRRQASWSNHNHRNELRLASQSRCCPVLVNLSYYFEHIKRCLDIA
jgi:hypothetical protein